MKLIFTDNVISWSLAIITMHHLQQLLETSTHAMNVYAAKMRQNINYIDEENFTGRKCESR